MVRFCQTIQADAGLRAKYQKLFDRVVAWYCCQYQKAKPQLEKQAWDALQDVFEGEDFEQPFSDSLEDSFTIKLSVFCVADFLCKLLLSRFSFGPDASDARFNFSAAVPAAWLDYRGGAIEVTEILQEFLNDSSEEQPFDLAVLSEERFVRNLLAHSGGEARCLSAIRCYNNIRGMIIFLDPDAASQLQEFSYPKGIAVNFQKVMSFGSFEFQHRTKILVVGSMHDMHHAGMSALAAMPWDVVIDFDTGRKTGALRETVQRHIIEGELSASTVSNCPLATGTTAWFTCGTCVSPYLDQKSAKLFNRKKPYAEGGRKNFRKVFSNDLNILYTRIAKIQNPVDIVFLYFDKDIADTILRICEDTFEDISYSFFALYYWSKETIGELEKAIYSDDIADGTSYDDRFLVQQGPLDAFFSCVSEYLPEYTASQTLSDVVLKKLPSSKGELELPVNLSVNLEVYFDCLYSGCGTVSPEEENAELNSFYHGGEATWSVLARKAAVQLLDTDEYDKYVNRVRSSLGRMQEKPKDRIFYLTHLPGIGGSTLVRQIGWDIHESYPVLLIQHYEKVKTIEHVKQLYDFLQKGILILVDEGFDTLADLENDVRTLQRPCSLLISMREENDVSGSCTKLPFSVITRRAEDDLRRLFRRASALPEQKLQEKDKNYQEFISVDKDGKKRMRVPFMIGLYYQDEQFTRVEDYVRAVVEQCDDLQLLKAVAFVVFCDIYGSGFRLPMVFINKYVGGNPRENLLKKYPYLARAFYVPDSSGTACYCSRHYIISRELLRLCGKKVFGKTLDEALYDWAIAFADAVFAASAAERTFEGYGQILEQLFIRNRTSIPVDLSVSQSDFSMVVESIPVPELRRDLLLHLAEKSAGLASNDAPEAYMAAAHYYGHLSRLHQKYLKNIEKAGEYSEQSIRYMELCGKKDSRVYHMHGMMKKAKLRNTYDFYLQNKVPLADGDYEVLEGHVEDALHVFENAAAGSPVYAYTGSVEVILDYLQFVYTAKCIVAEQDFSKLSPRQHQFQMEVEEFIELLGSMELEDDELQYYNSLIDKYKSQIMLGNFSKAIEYYQSRLDTLMNAHGSAQEIINARRYLISARLGKYRAKNAGDGLYMWQIPKKELETILSLLENTFAEIAPSTFLDIQRRLNAYNRWMSLAKYSTRTIEVALRYATDWMSLQEKHNVQDARPYYYLYVLYYLSALEGYQNNLQRIAEFKEKSRKCASRAGYSTERIHDILVDGTGMGQLCDCRNIEDIGNILATQGIAYRKLSGVFDRTESKKGLIRIQNPMQWNKEYAKFRLGEKNTLGELQVSHNVVFYGGFSYEQLCAFDATVRDTDTGETLASP